MRGFLPDWVIWVKRDAFETVQPSDKHYVWVLAAAQYILWSGQSVFKYATYSKDVIEEDPRPWDSGPLYDGKPLMDLDRWRFWKEGFRAVEKSAVFVAQDELGKECSDVSRRAAEIMEVLEKSMSF